jgi:hypothetical protein
MAIVSSEESKPPPPAAEKRTSMPTIVQRVSNAGAQGTRWHATPNAHQRKDQTFKISEKKEQRTSPEWLTFTAVKWISSSALQTRLAGTPL